MESKECKTLIYIVWNNCPPDWSEQSHLLSAHHLRVTAFAEVTRRQKRNAYRWQYLEVARLSLPMLQNSSSVRSLSYNFDPHAVGFNIGDKVFHTEPNAVDYHGGLGKVQRITKRCVTVLWEGTKTPRKHKYKDLAYSLANFKKRNLR